MESLGNEEIKAVIIALRKLGIIISEDEVYYSRITADYYVLEVDGSVLVERKVVEKNG